MNLDALRAKAELYRTAQGDEYGYVHDKCDSILFTSLCKIAGGCTRADIYASESKTEPGRWYRSPSQDCFDLGQSRSDFSRDMMIGLTAYLYSQRDLAAVDRILAHGAANNYVMGRYDGNDMLIGRAQWVSLIPYVKRIRAAIAREPIPEEPETRSIVPINTGFRAHLDVLKIWMDGKVRGSIDSLQLETLRRQVDRQPRNALYLSILSLYDGEAYARRAVDILLDETLFPSTAFPSESGRCTEYLWQRDDGADWQGCSKGQSKHSGTDFLFALKILEGTL